jgi:negative regulator of flagellin synthesis FlgM
VPNKIDGYKSPQIVAAPSNKARAAAKSGTDTAASASDVRAVDQLTLTQSARTLQKVAEAVANAPIADAGKVEAIKHSVDHGTYKVDAGRVADKLIAFEKRLK